MSSKPDKLKRNIIRLLNDSESRLTPLDVEKYLLSINENISKKTIQHLLKELISEGDLVYTYELGSSFLEPSFEKPVRVSDHVVIKPDRCSFSAKKDDIVILLKKGASFGSGRHPSTRLALKAMETILLQGDINNHNQTALDIGTGSGVLAITAVLMGMNNAVGLDIDPCARFEAMQNISLNQLTKRVTIDHRPFESIQETFFLVLANLRFPTLADFYGHISGILANNGFAVFSGLKVEEIDSIEKRYIKKKITTVHQFAEKGWASVVLHKTG